MGCRRIDGIPLRGEGGRERRTRTLSEEERATKSRRNLTGRSGLPVGMDRRAMSRRRG